MSFEIVKFTMQGVNASEGTAVISVPGVKVGDRVLLSDANNPSNLERVVSVDNQILQYNLNWTTQPPFATIFLREIL